MAIVEDTPFDPQFPLWGSYCNTIQYVKRGNIKYVRGKPHQVLHNAYLVKLSQWVKTTFGLEVTPLSFKLRAMYFENQDKYRSHPLRCYVGANLFMREYMIGLCSNRAGIARCFQAVVGSKFPKFPE